MDKENSSALLKEAKNSLAKGEIKSAMELLRQNPLIDDSNIQSHFLEYENDFDDIENLLVEGNLSRREYSEGRNRITHGLLELIESLPETKSSEASKEKAVKKPRKKVQTAYEMALERINEAKKTKKETLDLSQLGLTEIPVEVNEIPHLTELNLGDNEITRIENLDKLVNLKRLDFTLNEITSIQNLSGLKNLINLNLSVNEITAIEGLNDLKELRVLSLSYNPIGKIQNIEKLKKLEALFLDSCGISTIENLSGLKNLETLSLGQNKIEKIENLSGLPRLGQLYLERNKLNEVLGVSELNRLYFLGIQNNSISAKALLNNTGFFQYLRSRTEEFTLYIDHNPFLDEIPSLNKSDYPENQNHLNTFLKDEPIITNKATAVEIDLPHKLVLLGNSNAGKSSLVDFLRTGKLQDGSPKKSTEVLDIVTWKPRNKPEFFIYDFGGQDYYHATYQMFFSEEASYVLLWSKESNHNYFNTDKTDLRPEEYYCFDVNYWLGNIRYLNETVNTAGKDENKGWYKNLIMVENKIDIDFDDPNPLKTDERFGEIEQFKISLWKPGDQPIFETRRKWLKDFLQSIHHNKSEETQERKDAIQAYLNEWPELKKIKNEWPFLELKKYLKNKFESWAKLDDNDFSRILNRFNVSGLIIWYANEEKLQDRVWVDPNELQAPILNLLNHDQLKDFHGKIPLAAFNELTEFEHYRDLLLQKQIITYDEHDEIYIVPQKLPLNPEEDPLYRIAIQGLKNSFVLKFKNFMPLGIMNRLIRLFGKISDKKFYSRYEMVFSLNPEKVSQTFGEEKILLQCDMESLTLTISSTNDSEVLWKEIFVKILLAYHRMEDSFSDLFRGQEQLVQSSYIGKTRSTASLNFEELIPNDLQIALGDEYFVDYAEINEAVNSNLKKVKVCKTKEDIKEVRVYKYRAFFFREIKKPKKVFISYSHDDLEYRRELQKYLINMERSNLIEVWQDGMIQPGTDWDLTIKENLENADIIILLVSQSFISSYYIHEVELRKTMEKQLNQSARFFPILIKNCDFRTWKALPKKVVESLEDDGIPLAKFQFMPQFGKDQRLKPINSWEHPEDAWVQINEALRKYVTS